MIGGIFVFGLLSLLWNLPVPNYVLSFSFYGELFLGSSDWFVYNGSYAYAFLRIKSTIFYYSAFSLSFSDFLEIL